MFVEKSTNAISWFEPNTFLDVIGTQVDGDYSGTDKVFKILNRLMKPIDESRLEPWEIEVLAKIR
jgi:hypothetical protein